MTNGYDNEHDDEEYYPLNIPDMYRNIDSKEFQLPVRDIWNKFLDEDLVVDPDFQRHFVWDRRRSSRYIESLLLRIPTPPVFVSEEQDGRWIVVDGHQRLGTLFRFMAPLVTGRGRRKPPAGTALAPLRLAEMEVMPELNDKTIDALSLDARMKLWETNIRVVLIPKTAHEDMKYVLFARLNLGSVNLNAQELRNCIYRGPYNKLIEELSQSNDFRRLWPQKEADTRRMKDRERVLRFFALLHRRDRYASPIKSFLDAEMLENRDRSDDHTLRNEFRTALKWVERVFTTDRCFRRFEAGNDEEHSGRWIRGMRENIYDVQTVGFASISTKLDSVYKLLSESDKGMFIRMIRNRLAGVMSEQRFKDSLFAGSMRPENVRLRFERWMSVLEPAVQKYESTIEMGRQLEGIIERRSACVVCGIRVIWEDAILAPDGRRVMHRYCANPSIG